MAREKSSATVSVAPVGVPPTEPKRHIVHRLATPSRTSQKPSQAGEPPASQSEAKGLCYRDVVLELTVGSRLRTIRRDTEWCDRDGRAPQIESSVSRVGESALDRRKGAHCSKTELRLTRPDEEMSSPSLT